MEKQKVECLFLSEPDMIKAGVLDVKQCVNVMEETLRLLGEGDYVMGGPSSNSHGLMLWYPKESPFANMPLAGPDRRYMAMPAYLGGRFNICGLKWYGSNIANHSKGLPRSILMTSLNDAETGAPTAIFSANLASAVRTGAVPGVAAKYMAASGASELSVIGCGVINRACARAILYGKPSITTINVYDIIPAASERFISELKQEYPEHTFIIADSVRASVANADVISVAASGKVDVEFEESWLKDGSLLILSGHAGIADSFYLNNKVAFDFWGMHKAWMEEGLAHKDGIKSLESFIHSYQALKMYNDGMLNEEYFFSLSDVVTGKAKIRDNKNDKVIFLAGGIPVEDIAWGYTVSQRAREMGLGQTLTLWDEAHWM